MPELPEVETVVRSLQDLKGSIVAPETLSTTARYVQYELARGTVGEVARKGKWVVLTLEGKNTTSAAAIHLGMSGQLQIVKDRPDIDHVKALWTTGAGWLYLKDPRGFGRVEWRRSAGELVTWLSDRVSADPFEVSEQEFARRVSQGSRWVKYKLLDQKVVAGVGNIYADEALWAAKVDPFCTSLTASQCADLLASLREVMSQAIAAGGSTLRDFKSAHGTPGKAQELHKCYGRAGLPCLRCGASLERSSQGGRTTVRCPACQTGARPGA